MDPTGRWIVYIDGWNGLDEPGNNLHFWTILYPSAERTGTTPCSDMWWAEHAPVTTVRARP